MKLNVYSNQIIKKHLQIYLFSICTLIGLYSRTLTAEFSVIEKEVGSRRFATIGFDQKQDIASILKGMTSEEQRRFFESFNYHYNRINTSRTQDTVSINLSTISYHNPNKITQDDISKIIKLAETHAMRPRNHKNCSRCSH